ncbi:MAG TPA: glycosyltransferase N-terminal domain-containing protein [Paludibacteraceae bacterium]|nr:glycosyltransferase N-terminal domain-containing protein [Paludibacteraceae bacterium]HRS67751.1 glycosyltransferase N-terminal domain-containing protein [Paludibacteraceae bacterium]
MHVIYNLSIFLMRCFVAVMSPFKRKMRLRYEGSKEVFRILEENIDKSQRYVWFHAASLGEFEQGRPVIERLRSTQPKKKIILTFFSPSGYEIRKNYAEVDLVCYLPFDTPSHVKRFLDIVNPEKAIFIKYEFWANYLLELKKREIPTYIISAIFRSQQLFFKKYGGFFLNLLDAFTLIFVQDEESKALLNQFGVKHVTVGGDTRFDRVADIAEIAHNLPIAEAFVQGGEVLVAGSTWEPDEDLLTRYVNANYEEHKLIIAPHEVSDEHITNLTAKLRCNFVLYTQTTPAEAANAHCLVIDTIGVLSSLYRYGKVAYVGGGFGAGIHNTLEAAVWNMPVVFGPNYQKIREARELITCGGGYSVTSYRQMEDRINALFLNTEAATAAGDYVKKHVGATDFICKQVFN